MRKLAALLFAIVALAWSPRAGAGTLSVYHVHVIWIQGEGEGNQAALDGFIDCLFHHSTFETYWNGDVLVREVGSYVVPKPTTKLGDAGNLGPFVEAWIAAKLIPPPPSYGTPIYQVMVDPAQTSTVLGGGTGGRNAVGVVQGKNAGLIMNTTNPAVFWPARVPLAGETQLTEHEIAEVIDGLRGGYQCCGDFCCEGWCNNTASCGNFAGLECPGAPASTFTGSSSCGDVKGWLVQKLTHAGATTCSGSPTCDFGLGESCSTNSDNLHAPCTTSAECCGGLVCQKWTYSGHPDDPPANVCCKAATAACSRDTDCCGGMNCDATSHTCACVAKDAFCVNDSDCCGGLSCQGSVCAAVAPPPPLPDAGADASDAAPKPEASPDGGTDVPTDSGCACDVSRRPTGQGGILAVLAFVLWIRRRASRERTG